MLVCDDLWNVGSIFTRCKGGWLVTIVWLCLLRISLPQRSFPDHLRRVSFDIIVQLPGGWKNLGTVVVLGLRRLVLDTAPGRHPKPVLWRPVSDDTGLLQQLCVKLEPSHGHLGLGMPWLFLGTFIGWLPFGQLLELVQGIYGLLYASLQLSLDFRKIWLFVLEQLLGQPPVETSVLIGRFSLLGDKGLLLECIRAQNIQLATHDIWVHFLFFKFAYNL